jgi:DNA-binding beta-propeller fold protein YncE
MEFDGRSLWVIDKEARVQQIDPETGRAGVWWRMAESELGMPTGVTVAPAAQPDGSLAEALYVADTHYHRVLVYALPTERPENPREIEPVLLASFGSAGTGPGQFVYPTDVAVLLDASGGAIERIYVSEYGGNDRVSVFDAGHRFLFSFGTLGEGLDPAALEFSRPQSMVIDPARRVLYIADSCNHRIGRFSLEGELLGWIGTPEPGGSEDSDIRVRLNFPYSVDLLADGSLLVTEFGAGQLQRLDPGSGGVLGAFGIAGRGEGELATPWCSVVGGRVTFVLDSGNNRLLVTALPGVVGVREGGRL